MRTDIQNIIFDVGNTLRIVIPDPEFSAAAERELMELVESKETHDAFFAKVETGWNAYRKYSKKALLEASEMELWTQWLLPDYPGELVARNAARLTRLWRDHDGRREPRPDVVPTLRELHARGYTLGIIANTITETEIPDWMFRDEVATLFKATILSSKVRIRKPDPEIYKLCCRILKVEEKTCAYIGDNPVRDIEGTIAAGYGMSIRLDAPGCIKNEKSDRPIPTPDKVISSLSDLLEIFPA